MCIRDRQHFDMESTVFERGGYLLYISIKKSFSTFLTFFPILGLYLPFYDRQHGTFLCGRKHIMPSTHLRRITTNSPNIVNAKIWGNYTQMSTWHNNALKCSDVLYYYNSGMRPYIVNDREEFFPSLSCPFVSFAIILFLIKKMEKEQSRKFVVLRSMQCATLSAGCVASALRHTADRTPPGQR